MSVDFKYQNRKYSFHVSSPEKINLNSCFNIRIYFVSAILQTHALYLFDFREYPFCKKEKTAGILFFEFDDFVLISVRTNFEKNCNVYLFRGKL